MISSQNCWRWTSSPNWSRWRWVFGVLGYRFHRDGKESQGADRTLCKGMASWWRDRCSCRSKSVPMTTKCRRVLSHLCSTAFSGSVNWPWSVTIWLRRAWEAKILRFAFRCMRKKAGLATDRRQVILYASNGGRWVCRRWSKICGQILDDYELGRL